jgi:DNA repair protein RecO (recombination protein O)
MGVMPVWCAVVRRKKSVAQCSQGNRVQASWRARLSEQLGQMQLELTQAVAARFLDSPLRLAGVASVCALLDGALAEREPHAGLYAGTDALLSLINMDEDDSGWLEGYVRWELGLLHAVGYQLDLARCAASGETRNLGLCQPKIGRRRSQAACRDICQPVTGFAGIFRGRCLSIA